MVLSIILPQVKEIRIAFGSIKSAVEVNPEAIGLKTQNPLHVDTVSI